MKDGKYQQSLIIEFDYPHDDLDPLFDLEMRLTTLVEDKGLGIFDGNEIGIDTTDARYYIYGPDVKKIFEEIRPFLRAAPFMSGAVATLCLGPIDEPAPILEIAV